MSGGGSTHYVGDGCPGGHRSDPHVGDLTVGAGVGGPDSRGLTDEVLGRIERAPATITYAESDALVAEVRRLRDRLVYANKQRDVARDQRDRLEDAWGDEHGWRVLAEADRDRLADAIRTHRDAHSTKNRPQCLCPAGDAEEPWAVETVNECPWHGDEEHRVHVPGPRESNFRLWAALDQEDDRDPQDGMTDEEAADAFLEALDQEDGT